MSKSKDNPAKGRPQWWSHLPHPGAQMADKGANSEDGVPESATDPNLPGEREPARMIRGSTPQGCRFGSNRKN
jgi:hypothetical protein